MQINSVEKTTAQPLNQRFRARAGARLKLWLGGWRKRHLQARDTALTSELNSHLRQDIGHEDVRPERGRLSGHHEARNRAFSMELLRKP